MEQGRIVIAVVLSFLVFLVYDLYFVPKDTPTQAPETTAREGNEAESKPSTEPASQPVAPKPAEVPASVQEARTMPARSFRVETPLYIADLTENGAVLFNFRLKHYRESTDSNAPLKNVLGLGQEFGAFRLFEEEDALKGLQNAVFTADSTAETLEVEQGQKTLRFEWVSESGVRVAKTYRFSADAYTIGLDVTVRNEGVSSIRDPLGIAIYQPVGESSRQYGFEGPIGLINGQLEEINPKKLEKEGPVSGTVTWIGEVDRYFMRTLIPREPVEGTMRMRIVEDKVIESRLVASGVEIGPGVEQQFEYIVFLGPKALDILGQVGHDLKKALNFGMFDFLAKPLLWLMNQIYKVIPNYGIAIILLTILTKIILWPLGTKSYKSMADMRRLQPLMAEIREKYKNDKKKVNEEMMGLYRTYKINPMGGCLPMVVQIPFFFALYRMLYEAIELRHAPFVGWINDLSAPDRLFRFGFSIPFMEPPYGIPVLTLVMGATMFLQQKMTPTPGDPAQAKIMMFMPIIFTVIFINFSAGLVLYWLTNNILSIGQQYYIQRKYA
jgi:YidC/Oxa1 family membrane protein insertase